jgi:hypothetical protein
MIPTWSHGTGKLCPGQVRSRTGTDIGLGYDSNLMYCTFPWPPTIIVPWPPTITVPWPPTIIASNDFFCGPRNIYVPPGTPSARRNPVQRGPRGSHDPTQQHRSPSRCGGERISQRTYNVYPLFGNIDAVHAMYGRAVLPCSELVLHDTHPPTRNQILAWRCVGSGNQYDRPYVL